MNPKILKLNNKANHQMVKSYLNRRSYDFVSKFPYIIIKNSDVEELEELVEYLTFKGFDLYELTKIK